MIDWQNIPRLLCFAFLLEIGSGLRAQEVAEPNVLFSFDRKQAAATTEIPATTAANRQIDQVPPAPLPSTPSPSTGTSHYDPAVTLATRVNESASSEPAKDSRRLATKLRSELLSALPGDAKARVGQLPFELPKFDSLGTAGAGLVLVVGLFLLCASLMRRGGPSPTSPLPRDAVAMLGRIPLTPKQFAHLLQVGNKLVLVSISGDRTDTITEVTEPAEVDRLLTLCMKGSKQSTSAEFQRMLQQMAKEPVRGFLGKEAATNFPRSARG